MQQENRDFLIHFSMTHGSSAYVHVPNEIFKVIRDNVEEPKRKSFAFNYMILTGLLYKYAHFSDSNNRYVKRCDIKDMLGYSPKNKYIDKVVSSKDNLMKNGYIIKSRDVPVAYELYDDGFFEVKTVNSYKHDDILYKKLRSTIPKNYTFNYPQFLYKYNSWCGEIEYDGTLFEIDDTFKINIAQFLKIIISEELSEVDKYLYFYMYKRNNDNKKSSISQNTISLETGFDSKTIRNSLKRLQHNGFLEVEKGKRFKDKNGTFTAKPNSYLVEKIL